MDIKIWDNTLDQILTTLRKRGLTIVASELEKGSEDMWNAMLLDGIGKMFGDQ